MAGGNVSVGRSAPQAVHSLTHIPLSAQACERLETALSDDLQIIAPSGLAAVFKGPGCSVWLSGRLARRLSFNFPNVRPRRAAFGSKYLTCPTQRE